MLKIPSLDSNEYRSATVMASVMILLQYHCDVLFEMYDQSKLGRQYEESRVGQRSHTDFDGVIVGNTFRYDEEIAANLIFLFNRETVGRFLWTSGASHHVFVFFVFNYDHGSGGRIRRSVVTFIVFLHRTVLGSRIEEKVFGFIDPFRSTCLSARTSQGEESDDRVCRK